MIKYDKRLEEQKMTDIYPKAYKEVIEILKYQKKIRQMF